MKGREGEGERKGGKRKSEHAEESVSALPCPRSLWQRAVQH